MKSKVVRWKTARGMLYLCFKTGDELTEFRKNVLDGLDESLGRAEPKRTFGFNGLFYVHLPGGKRTVTAFLRKLLGDIDVSLLEASSKDLKKRKEGRFIFLEGEAITCAVMDNYVFAKPEKEGINDKMKSIFSSSKHSDDGQFLFIDGDESMYAFMDSHLLLIPRDYEKDVSEIRQNIEITK